MKKPGDLCKFRYCQEASGAFWFCQRHTMMSKARLQAESKVAYTKHNLSDKLNMLASSVDDDLARLMAVIRG